jgi:hypothetical protein
MDFDNPEVQKSFQRVARTQQAFVREVKEQTDQLKEEEESSSAYFSDSWNTDIKRKREAKGLPVSDVARFASVVDTISGNERQNRTDIQIFPFEKDDQLTADVGNLYLKYRDRKESHWHENSLGFVNAIVSKRAHFEFFLRNNPNDGSLETVRIQRPASEVFIQKPFTEITANDSRGTFHAQWVFVDDLKRQFGNKIDVTLLDFTQPEQKPVFEISRLLDAYDFPDRKNSDLFFKKADKKMVRVVRWWEKRKKSVFRVLNPAPTSFDEILIASESSRTKAVQLAVAFFSEQPEVAINLVQNTLIQADGERIVEPTTENIEVVANEIIEEQFKDIYAFQAISGRVELDYVPEWGDFLPWAHLFCYFVDGKAGGLHERIKDLIQEVNFIHAKLSQRLGTMGKMPLVMEEGATNMDDDAIRDNFEDGGVLKVVDGAVRQKRYEVLEDKTLSSIPAFITLEESLNNTIKELTGANDPLQGRSPGANTAGIAIDLLQRRGAALIAPIEDNYKRFRLESARIEIQMLLRAHNLRPNWTSMKLAKIVGGMLPRVGKAAEPLAEMMEIKNQETPEGDDSGVVLLLNSILQKMSTMEYDFTVDEIIHSPTMRMTILQMLANTARVLGIPIDPSVVIESTELPQNAKDRLLQFSTSEQGAEQVAARQATGGQNENGSLENITQ